MNRLIPYSEEVYAYLTTAFVEAHAGVAILSVLAVIALLVFGGTATSMMSRTVVAGLAALWAWIGIGFYWQVYQPINWAGAYFGWAALLQAAATAVWGATKGRLAPVLEFRSARCVTALIALALAALTGPVALFRFGVGAVTVQAVGVTPLATITAILALYLLNRSTVPFWLLPLPVALLVWEGIRIIVHGVPQDAVLLLAAVLVLVFLFGRFRDAERS